MQGLRQRPGGAHSVETNLNSGFRRQRPGGSFDLMTALKESFKTIERGKKKADQKKRLDTRA